jgi:membrane-bound lytic murein transglycosylase B
MPSPLIFLILFLPGLAFAGAWPEPSKIEEFATEMASRHSFDKDEVKLLLNQLQPNERVLQAIAPPDRPDAKSWRRYRARFLSPQRVTNGVRFWQEHAETLKRAEDDFGVPAEVIVAIIGVETEYGKNKGQFSVLDALATLAFAYPPRADYFRHELEEFLLLARENKFAPESVKGSFAGALGIPQFMPGSQRRFAIDFDQDGRVDLSGSAQDAIGSVARFLKLHGWSAKQSIAEPLKGELAEPQKWVAMGIKPSIEKTVLVAAGIGEPSLPADQTATLVDLETPGEKTEYWWGYNNFYVITRYNRSSFYAMSVAELGSAIMQEKMAGVPNASKAAKTSKAAKKTRPRANSRAKRRRA